MLTCTDLKLQVVMVGKFDVCVEDPFLHIRSHIIALTQEPMIVQQDVKQ